MRLDGLIERELLLDEAEREEFLAAYTEAGGLPDGGDAPAGLDRVAHLAERITRRGATINVFLLDDTPALVDFVHAIAARNGGRVFSPDPERLGEYVVSDYLNARQGRRRSA